MAEEAPKQKPNISDKTDIFLEKHIGEFDERLRSYKEQFSIPDATYTELLAGIIEFVVNRPLTDNEQVVLAADYFKKVVEATENFITFEAQNLATPKYSAISDLEGKIRQITYQTATRYPHFFLSPGSEETGEMNDRLEGLITNRLDRLMVTQAGLGELREDVPDKESGKGPAEEPSAAPPSMEPGPPDREEVPGEPE